MHYINITIIVTLFWEKSIQILFIFPHLDKNLFNFKIKSNHLFFKIIYFLPFITFSRYPTGLMSVIVVLCTSHFLSYDICIFVSTIGCLFNCSIFFILLYPQDFTAHYSTTFIYDLLQHYIMRLQYYALISKILIQGGIYE